MIGWDGRAEEGEGKSRLRVGGERGLDGRGDWLGRRTGWGRELRGGARPVDKEGSRSERRG